ncbi:NAD-dependent epimerase/dehydratase family protein [Candidatus Poribacteria bacterium]|nr:NAD-dependent epimerase/dehydratase family protein [Candidatus Poribacteria bacterium]
MNDLSGSRVLITGGAGLVGSHIADKMVVEGADEIIILDNLTRGSKDNLSWAVQNGNVKFVEGDIRNLDFLNKALKGVDYVFHQAAIRITQCARTPREALEVLFDGTFNVLEASVDAKVKKIVAASSVSIYGMAESFPTEETHHPYNNRTIYGAGKIANEQMLRAFNDMYGLDYVALRYFNVYGPRMDVFGFYTEVMIRWLDRIDAGKPPLIFGDGKQSMDFVYVEDIAEANILALKSDVSDEVFNVGTGIEISLSDLLGLMLKLTGSDLKPLYEPPRKVSPVQRRLASTEKAKSMLGFKAKTSLEIGLKKLIEWRKEVIAKSKEQSDEHTNN